MRILIWIVVLSMAGCIPVSGQSRYQATYDSINLLMDKEDYPQALEVCKRIIAEDSNQMNAWHYRAYCEGELKQHQSAAYSFSKVAHFSETRSSYWVSATWHSLLSGQYDSAVYYGEQAMKLEPEDFNNYLNLAHAYYLKTKWPQAQYYYILASQYLPQGPEFLEAVMGDLILVDSIYKSAFIDGVKAMFNEDFTLAKNNHLSNRILDTIHNLTTQEAVPEKQTQLIRLKKAFVQAQENEEIKRFMVLRDFYYSLGMAELYSGNNKDAFTQYFPKGIMIDEHFRDSLSLVMIHYRLSKDVLNIQVSKNPHQPKIDDAIYFAQESLRHAEKYNFKDGMLAALFQLGECYYSGSQYDSAAIFYKKALAHSPIKGVYGVHDNLLYKIATTYAELGDFEAAKPFFDRYKKRSGYVQDPHHRYLSGTINMLAALYKTKQYPLVAQQSLELLPRAKKFLAMSDNVSFLEEIAGLSYYFMGKPDSALLFLQRSVDTYTDYATARRDKYPNEKVLLVQDEKKSVFFYLRKLYAARKMDEALFHSIELSKEGLLSYLLTDRVVLGSYASLAGSKQQLPSNAAALQFSNFFDVEGGIGISFNNQDHLVIQHRNKELSREFEKLPQYQQIVKWMMLTNDTKNNSQRLSMFLPMTYYLQCSGFQHSSRGTITSSKVADSSAMSDAARVAVSKLLYKYYIKPYESLIKGKEVLYISPDLFLNYIPFEALIDEQGRYLGELYNIIYVPSFSVKTVLESKTYSDDRTLIAFGNPDYTKYDPSRLSGRAWDYAFSGSIKNWSELPGTEKELNILRQTVSGCTIFQREDLSETRLKKWSGDNKLKNAGILHFALHGFTNVNAGYQDNSLVVSEPGVGEEDGLLQFWEIFRLNLSPRLTFLSACETGLGFPKDDGSSTSIVTAFLAAGSGSCIGTNWKISDEVSTLFVREFYKLVQQKVEFSEALHQVKKKFISGEMGKDYRSPYYWAAFKYYGF